MAAEADEDNPMVDRLVLDMKAVGLLYNSDVELRETMSARVVGSHDEQVRRVLASVAGGRPRKERGNFLIAVGELLLASFLMIFGLLLIVPLIGGAVTSTSLVNYFGTAIGQFAASNPVFPALPELVIVLAVLLLMSALYALRKASGTLKEEGYLSR